MSTLYISDLDGTLLNSNTELSEKTKGIINSLVRKGIKFTYATARSFSSASRVVQGLELSMPVITYNGAFFVKPQNGQTIYSTAFSDEQIKYISNIFINNKIAPLVYSLIDDEEKVSWLKGTENKGMVDYFEARKEDKRLRPINNEADLYSGSVFYFTVIGEKDALENLKFHFNDKTQFICTLQQELYKDGEYWLEVMPHNASKARGVELLKEFTGCDKVVCFGDAINDISMFKIADERYAVANANAMLKQFATNTIASNDEDGVALWLLENAI
ncbi:HAD family hydrolase [Clostridium sp. C8-1-8]|uniref:HAD family hydrolase n=1 Tax=Clostridium sp. C8-1-8 TaxID=2698831 RepID=UPI00136FCC6E|nr:HAD family hydrolase [Clostridium sp. C8-1-8]